MIFRKLWQIVMKFFFVEFCINFSLCVQDGSGRIYNRAYGNSLYKSKLKMWNKFFLYEPRVFQKIDFENQHNWSVNMALLRVEWILVQK